jgi:hypothetical protein
VDRYALEHGGATALDDEDGDDPDVRTDGGEDEDDDEWNPEPASLRDGETPDEDSHAARNARMLREARRELDRYDSDEATQDDVEEAVEGVEDENGSLNEEAIREQLADSEDELREFSEEYEPVEGDSGAYRRVEDDEEDA